MKTRYDLAIGNAREAIEELRLAAYEQGYKDAVADAHVSKPLSRNEIIEQAKRDVAEGIKRKWSVDGSLQYIYYPNDDRGCGYISDVEFVVNAKKRTVVALVRWSYDGKLLAKGIAKCDPSDCFNAHIGKAIAVRRALGLDVPSEYLNAPQPTEVRVGDIIMPTILPKNKPLVVVKTEAEVDLIKDSCAIDSLAATRGGKIIDDSREVAE
jgi:hypothetical protein